jgi:hypothetical protein
MVFLFPARQIRDRISTASFQVHFSSSFIYRATVRRYVEPYSEVSQKLSRGHNKEIVLHKNLRKMWKKGKHETTVTRDRNKLSRRKRKIRLILNTRLNNSAKFQKLCNDPQCQQNSNPYRKEVKDKVLCSPSPKKKKRWALTWKADNHLIGQIFPCFDYILTRSV